MNTKETRAYRAMFWIAALLAAFTVVYARGAGKSVEPRLDDDPHDLSALRGVEYPFTIDIFGYRYRGKTGDYIDDYILAYGAYEKDVLFFLRDYVRARGNPEAVFLDVGACEGQHSLFMSRLVKDVHAFEPYPPAAERFRSLVDLNDFTNIRLHEVGLGDKGGTVPFYAPPEKNIGSGTFLPAHKQGAEKAVGSFDVVIGDAWLAPLGLTSVDAVKIDVEGFEKNVLEGLAKTLDQFRPIVVVEVTHPPRGTIASVDELKRLFPERYRLLKFRLAREDAITGRYVLEPIVSLDGDNPYDMVLAYPQERESLIHRKPHRSEERAMVTSARR